MRSFLANFGNLCENHWELINECQQHTILRPTDKLKEPTKCWKVILETLSTTIRTIGIVRHTKHPRRNHYSDQALLAIHTVVAHYHTKEEALAPAM